MFLEAMILWAVGSGDLPPLSDRDRFPGWSVCRDQLERYRACRAELQERRWRYSYGDGRCDVALAWLDDCIRVWWLLERAHACEFGHGDDWHRGHLLRLRDLLGEDAYRAGWRPPLLPEPPPVKAMPRVESNQTN